MSARVCVFGKPATPTQTLDTHKQTLHRWRVKMGRGQEGNGGRGSEKRDGRERWKGRREGEVERSGKERMDSDGRMGGKMRWQKDGKEERESNEGIG